jgi:Double zinc ribbon
VSTFASVFGSIHGVMHSSAVALAGDVLLAFAVVLWLGLGFRVYRDARRRIDDGFLVALATLLGFGIPFVGPLVYLLFRPPETLEDAHAREIEMHALRERLGRDTPVCPVCRSEVDDDFLVCPVCTTRLKQQCARCDAPLDPLWQLCPYCTAPVSAQVEAVPDFAHDLDAALTAETATNGDRAGRRTRRGQPLS